MHINFGCQYKTLSNSFVQNNFDTDLLALDDYSTIRILLLFGQIPIFRTALKLRLTRPLRVKPLQQHNRIQWVICHW